MTFPIGFVLRHGKQIGQAYNAAKYIGGAVGAYSGAKAVYTGAKRAAGTMARAVTKKQKVQTSRPTTGGGRTAGSTGAGYHGRLAKRVRKRRYSKKRSYKKRTYKKRALGENHFAQYGAIGTKEVSGIITDPDCVYLGHSSLVPDDLLRTVVYAIVRKLMKQAIGYEADNLRSVIPYKTVAGAQVGSGYTITIKYSSNLFLNTKAQQSFVITDDNSSIMSVGDTIFSRFRDQSSGNDVAKNERLLWIEVIDTADGHCRAHMDLTVMKVTLFSKSELKIQNVSIPNAEAVTEDNVNNVPLIGRSYHLSQWCPKTSDDDNSVMDIGIQNSGVITYRAGQLSGVQYETWKEPPPSKAFVNCYASHKQRLEPGGIKSNMSVFRRTMLLSDFLEALAYNTGSGGPSNPNKNTKIGKHDMFAFERLIGLTGLLPIKINYECNFFMGATVSARRPAAIMQKIGFVVQNNLPA